MSDESKEAAAEIPADEVLRGLQNFQSWAYAVASALPYATALVSQYREAKREMAEIVRVRETHLADLERAIAEREPAHLKRVAELDADYERGRKAAEEALQRAERASADKAAEAEAKEKRNRELEEAYENFKKEHGLA